LRGAEGWEPGALRHPGGGRGRGYSGGRFGAGLGGVVVQREQGPDPVRPGGSTGPGMSRVAGPDPAAARIFSAPLRARTCRRSAAAIRVIESHASRTAARTPVTSTGSPEGTSHDVGPRVDLLAEVQAGSA
jgi:hypothetical protein